MPTETSSGSQTNLSERVRVVITPMKCLAPPARVWDGLMFYERIEMRPPFFLRMLLPVPIGTDKADPQVGDDVMCNYVGGHLVKRIVEIEEGRYYGFEVVEQELDLGGGMRLSGGAYTLRELPDGNTELSVTTRYLSSRRPGWLWQPLESGVCHMFHRHLLRAIRARVESAGEQAAERQ